MSKKVDVVNSNLVWNGGPSRLKLKIAERYVRERRAEWVGENQLRFLMSHPENQAAARAAAAWQAETVPEPGRTGLSHAVACFPDGLRAAQRPTKFAPPPEREPRLLRVYRRFDDDGFALLRKDGKPRKRLPRLFPEGEPKELRGRSLPHEDAKVVRPFLMERRFIKIMDDRGHVTGCGHTWEAFTPSPDQRKKTRKTDD